MNKSCRDSEKFLSLVKFTRSNVEIGVNSVKLAILASKMALSYDFQKSC